MEPVQTELRNVFWGFLERTTKEPVCGTKSEICSDDSKSDIRRIVPYVMQVHRRNEEIYIRYAAVVGIKKYERENEKISNALFFRLTDQFICVAFDIYFGCLVASAGYFVVDKSALFTPEGFPVEKVHITPMEEVSSQLGMVLMINLQLTNFREYFASEDDPDIMMLANTFTRLMDREIPSASFASGIPKLPPLIKVPNLINKLPTSQQADGDETDSLSDISVVGLCSKSKVHTSDHLGFADDEDTVPFEGLITEDQTIVHTAEDLKNRKRVVFNQEFVDIETSDDWIDNIVDCHQIWKLSRSELVSQEDCRDLEFYQTKYYAGIPAGLSGGVVFYKRVFLIGQCLDKFLVIPYNNTDNDEEMKLQTPFGTDILYQRFLGDRANRHDAVTLVDCVDEDEIHIPEFVAPSDVFHILKYWKICTSKEEKIITRLINRLHAKPKSPIPFQSETLGQDVSLNQKRKVSWDHSYARKLKKLDFTDELSQTDGSDSTIPFTDNDSFQLSMESYGNGKVIDSNATEELESFVEGDLSESNASSCTDWNCIIDTRTKRIHKTFLSLGTTETWMLINQFVPFKEIDIHLKDFMTAQWETAYLGLTDYFADSPIPSSEDQNFFLNVLVLGHLQDIFIILPVKMNLLTTKMKIGRPCATRNLYTRKNRDQFMRRLNKNNVDFSIPTTYNIPDDQFVQALKYQHLVASGASCFQKAIYNRCTSSPSIRAQEIMPLGEHVFTEPV